MTTDFRRVFVISDMHLGHSKLTEDGIRTADFSEKILANLNKIMRSRDILIDLGDVAFGNQKEWFDRLYCIPGTKWLVQGNHDKRSFSWYMDHGYSMVCQSLSLMMYGKKILFSHTPMAIGDHDFNVHGHFHDFKEETIKTLEPHLFALLTPKHKLISMEELNYAPVKLQTLIAEFEKQSKI